MQKSWSILFGVVLVASLLLFIVAPFVGWWLPKSICSYGPGIYLLFYVILGVTAFFFVLTEAILVYNMWAFAHVPGRKSEYVHGNHKLEMFWTAVPGVLLLLQGIAEIIRCLICIRQGAWPARLHDVEETESIILQEQKIHAAERATPSGQKGT